jgi:hypothetical protein
VLRAHPRSEQLKPTYGLVPHTGVISI